MSCRKMHRGGASGTAGRRSRREDIVAYVAQVSGHKRLTREEQLELGRRLERGRRRCWLLLLANPFLLRAALAVLRRVALGTLQPGRTLLLAEKQEEEEAVAKALERVRRHVATLERILTHDRERFRQAMRRQTPAEDRRADLKLLVADSHRAARLVAKCRLRPRVLEALCGRLRRLARRIAGLKAAAGDAADADAASTARRQLVRLLRAAGEPLARLNRRLERAQAMTDGLADLREQLVRPFLPFVIWLAKRYRGRGLPLEDLIQEGNIGLLHAADTFDPHRGLLFGTHAGWYIRQRIRRAIDRDARTIRLPCYAVQSLQKIRRAQGELRCSLGRDPTSAELATAVGLKECIIQKLLGAELRKHSLETLARSGARHDATGTPGLDRIAGRSSADAEFAREVVAEVIGSLPAREQLVISLRFGLGEDGRHTLDEVGCRLGITKQRIRQIEQAALERLRYHFKRVLGR